MSSKSTLKCNTCNIVVNEVLSFVQNKVDVMNNVSLALICRQSFTEEEIWEAKCLLFDSVPQKRIQRRGEDKGKKNIEDIIGLLRCAEQDEVPVFVAKELHRLPPVTFDHVDVTRLLKDLMLMQKELNTFKEQWNSAKDHFITKEDLQQEICKINHNRYYENDAIQNSVQCETEPCVNTKRGGCIVRDSFDCSSGPMGLIACDESEISPTASNKPVGTSSLSYASATALGKDKSVSLQPAPRETNSQPQTFANKIPHANLHLKSMHPNNAFTPLVSREVCDKSSSGDNSAVGSDRAVLTNENKNEWIRVERRMRFKGTRGTAVVDSAGKFKAADVQIPLFIYNVDKETTERDVAEYIYEKTSVNIMPEKVKNINSEKRYNSYKFSIPRSKLPLFENNELWPEGIFFRRYILFKKGRKATGTEKRDK